MTITRNLSYEETFLWVPRWMIVCVCNRLNDAKIREAFERGATCADQVYTCCGVSKGCGRCQETIEDMLDEAQIALKMAAE